MATYSFLDVALSINGPNGSFLIGGDGAGNSEEGFSIVFEEDADLMTQGSDGSVMHSLSAAKRGRIDVHLLKTSPVNAQLSQMYTNDRANGSQQWAQNTLVARNPVSGDTYQAAGCAFRKFPDNTYAMRGNIVTWGFNASQIDPALGSLTIQ